MLTVHLVLVRPETAANVGACARVVRNAGLSGLDLVDPGDWRTVECWRTAWGAQDALEQARVFPDLAAALSGCTFAVGLTGRPTPASLDVREMAAQIAALGRDDTAALVLGPETGGLTRDELALCGRAATIPSHSDQPSLNLSHAAMVAAYEVFRARRPLASAPRRATHEEKESMIELLRQGLLAIEALPARGSAGYFRQWRAMLERADLTPKEVRLLEHMARKMASRSP